MKTNIFKRFLLAWSVLIFQLNTAVSQTNLTSPVFTPAPIAVAGVSQPTQSLNGEWVFSVNNIPAKKIKVPGEWEMQGFTVNEGETGVYTKVLNIPADWKGKNIKIRFEGVSSHAVVKVNGKKVAEHEGSFVPFEADITDALQAGNNTLTVEVQSRTISDILACTSQYAVHTVGGIVRNVTLMALPETHINAINAVTTFDKQYKNAVLQISASLDMPAPSPVALSSVQLIYTLKDAAGKVVGRGQTNNPKSVNITVANAKHWNPEHPYLYELTTELRQNGQPLQTLQQKVGFRQVEIKNARVFVNGQPIKLHGVNRHSVHPLTGRSISAALEVQDAVLFREANCNFIRTSHYPPTQDFLNACDSLGIFVEDESSLCWIQHHASPIWRKWNYKDEKFLPFMMAANLEKVIAHRNHPSIIMWSLGNESAWSPLWEKVNTAVKQLDPTRPTLLHDQCWGGFNNFGNKADIANYHYPGVNGGRATDTMSRPVFFGEYAHLATYNRRELLTDPGQRSFYGEPLAKMYDSMYYYPKCLGGAIWSGVDDIFHMPDGRLVGYGPWGPIDGWRRKKPEYFGMKKAYSPVKVVSAKKENGQMILNIENRYDFTSLKNIKITAAFDDQSPRSITSAIAPHGKGVIKIPLQKNTKTLRVRFTDPRGFVADEELYNLVDEDSSPITASVKNTFTENESAISIAQGDVSYLINKANGIIISIKKGDQTLMTQGPVFAIIPRNSEDGGKPNVAGETYQNNIHPLKGYPLYTIFASDIKAQQMGDSVQVSMVSSFHDGSKANITYTFTGNLLKANYEIAYKGKLETPYQYGMLMQLPKYMDELNWHRKGEFSTYPEDDIARTKGTAKLNARRTTGVEEWGVVPKNDWKDDATELGSNDFRSTKKNIYSASLSGKNNKVKAWGFGNQSSRSWLQDEYIQWLVADYCNNGSEPFYGSPFTDGRINIKDKTLKGGVVLEF